MIDPQLTICCSRTELQVLSDISIYVTMRERLSEYSDTHMQLAEERLDPPIALQYCVFVPQRTYRSTHTAPALLCFDAFVFLFKRA
jgi:hypothetical protein